MRYRLNLFFLRPIYLLGCYEIVIGKDTYLLEFYNINNMISEDKLFVFSLNINQFDFFGFVHVMVNKLCFD